MGVSQKTLTRMKRRVDELITNFSGYCDVFDERGIFTGPSLHFHQKTLCLLRSHDNVVRAVNDDTFLESLYATLTAWGMHRMGPGNTKLVELAEMKASLQSQNATITDLQRLSLVSLSQDECTAVAHRIWRAIDSLRIGVGQTKIVAGSKALHHVLPNLVVPIDREYTIRFFYDYDRLSSGEEGVFEMIYPHFREIAASCQDQIETRLGRGMNTSRTKVIDNAIVGHALRHRKSKPT